MKVYAFDVDECLEISNGPVSIQSMKDLRAEGHCIGVCGNMNVFCRVPDWHLFVSFLGQGFMNKDAFLYGLRMNIPADEYVMVGNILGELNSLGFKCGSDDKGAAERAGFRFIKEDLFAQGQR